MLFHTSQLSSPRNVRGKAVLMWVEFIIGFHICSEDFSPVFLSPQKPTFPNSNSTRNARTPLKRVSRELFDALWKNKLSERIFFFFFFGVFVLFKKE